MKKESLKDRIIARLKGGDDAKVSRFLSKLEKFLSKQVQDRKDQIATLTDKIVDANEDLADSVELIDLDSIKDTDSVEKYCRTYTVRIQGKAGVVDSLKDQIDTLEQEIEKLGELQDIIFSGNE